MAVEVEIIASIFDFLLAFGAPTMMVIIVTLLALVFGVKPGEAIRSGLYVGIGLLGLFTFFGLLFGELIPAADAISKIMPGELFKITDFGWPTYLAITLHYPTAYLVYPLCIVLNIVLLAVGLTKTLNVDMFNLLSMGYVMALTLILGGDVILAVVAAAIFYFALLKVADWTAPVAADPETFGMPGVSWAWNLTAAAPVCFFFNKVIDKIPGLNTLEADPEGLQERFGVFGDVAVLGLVIGIVMGIVAGYGVHQIAILGVSLATFMLLMPRVIAALVDGLTVIADATREFMTKRFPGKEILIGIDGAVAVSNPALMVSSTIAVPLTLLLAAVLPFNKVLPLNDLAFSWCFGIWAVGARKNNVVRGVIVQMLWMMFVLWQSTWMGPLITAGSIAAGYEVPAGVTITNMTPSGWFWPWALAAIIGGIFNAPYFEYGATTMMIVGIVLIGFYLGCWWVCKDDPKTLASISKEEMYKRIAKKGSIY